MERIEKQIQIDNLNKDDMVIDIETTGFSPKTEVITILGYILYDGDWKAVQLFNHGDERAVLEDFLKDLDGTKRIISFNGDAFDIKFIKARAKSHGLIWPEDPLSLDLYAYIRTNKAYSPYPVVGQNRLEEIYGIHRESDLDGRQAISLYKRFLKTKEPAIKKDLVYYNFLDIYNLAQLFDIYVELEDIKGFEAMGQSFSLEDLSIKKDRLTISLGFSQAPAYPVEKRSSNFKISWAKDLLIMADLTRGSLDQGGEALAFDASALDLVDQSPSRLLPPYVLIKSGSYQVSNLKILAQAIVEDAGNLMVFPK